MLKTCELLQSLREPYELPELPERPAGCPHMIRTFRYRLHPNACQEAKFNEWCQQCCALYNAALEQRITFYRSTQQWLNPPKHPLSRFDQQKQLTDLRSSDPAWKAVPAEVQRSALRRLELAYAGFYRRVRNGETPGFPRFRSERRYASFSLSQGITVHKKRLYVPKLGHVKFNLYRPILGTIKQATIQRDRCGKWWVSLQCDLGTAPPKVTVVHSIVGIDLGILKLAALSTGEEIPNPRFGQRAASQVAKRQRSLAKKQNGSKNRERARIIVAKMRGHIANQRLDHVRKEACKLVKRYDAIAHENLNIKALSHGLLSKSITDASWGIFLRCIASKAEEAGKYVLPVEYQKTSQLCSTCGSFVAKAISERMHRCVCGLTIDRDHNAAVNVFARGQRALELMHISVEREVSLIDKADNAFMGQDL